MKTHDSKLAVGHTVDLPANAAGGDKLQFIATDGLSQQLKQQVSGPARGLAIE
ncbi:hypothetical protein [Terriglobus sp.]|uniref:hypothetical protein n=1 Tax=Terriglobus sp. TaxID=1889013 RepID=UPI003B00C15C